MEKIGVVINRCYGGFSLSKQAIEEYLKLKDLEYSYVVGKSKWDNHFIVNGKRFSQYDIPRTDSTLVEVVSSLKEKANGDCAELYVEWIPKGTKYRIDEYDGMERLETEFDVSGWSIA